MPLVQQEFDALTNRLRRTISTGAMLIDIGTLLDSSEEKYIEEWQLDAAQTHRLMDTIIPAILNGRVTSLNAANNPGPGSIMNIIISRLAESNAGNYLAELMVGPDLDAVEPKDLTDADILAIQIGLIAMLGEKSTLQVLDLGELLDYEACTPVINCLKHNKNLKQLIIGNPDCHHFSSSTAANNATFALTDMLKKNQQLQGLRIYHRLAGTGGQAICEAISSKTELHSIYLDSFYSDEMAHTITKTISANPYLENITVDNFTKSPNLLLAALRHPSIRSLRLQCVHFSALINEQDSDIINSDLEELHLTSTDGTAENSSAFLGLLTSLPKLHTLTLSGILNHDTTGALCDLIENCELKFLDISQNKLRDLQSIARALHANTSLITLDISGNDFSAAAVIHFLEDMKKNNNFLQDIRAGISPDQMDWTADNIRLATSLLNEIHAKNRLRAKTSITGIFKMLTKKTSPALFDPQILPLTFAMATR